MQVGDKVRVYGEETEIVATAFDEQGEKVYMLKGYTRDFYEDEFGPMKFFLLESIIDLTPRPTKFMDSSILLKSIFKCFDFSLIANAIGWVE